MRLNALAAISSRSSVAALLCLTLGACGDTTTAPESNGPTLTAAPIPLPVQTVPFVIESRQQASAIAWNYPTKEFCTATDDAESVFTLTPNLDQITKIQTAFALERPIEVVMETDVYHIGDGHTAIVEEVELEIGASTYVFPLPPNQMVAGGNTQLIQQFSHLLDAVDAKSLASGGVLRLTARGHVIASIPSTACKSWARHSAQAKWAVYTDPQLLITL